jgi:hypothetical protein
VYGLTNLAKMEEDSLNKMDPYQRGATDISKCRTQRFAIINTHNCKRKYVRKQENNVQMYLAFGAVDLRWLKPRSSGRF